MSSLDKQLEDFQFVRAKMRDEGFHYCFESYSSFEEIEDPKFHELRKAYLAAANELSKHVNERIEDLTDQINHF